MANKHQQQKSSVFEEIETNDDKKFFLNTLPLLSTVKTEVVSGEGNTLPLLSTVKTEVVSGEGQDDKENFRLWA
uniref:Uncharacterized protein n=1 Tax=Meloidogyne javanica TaxID=6303 RepID=A0A915LHG6_MELJA